MSDYATYEVGGLFRCCAEAIPTDTEGKILAGKEGEHRPCPYCKDKETSGVRFHQGRWRAAWIKDE